MKAENGFFFDEGCSEVDAEEEIKCPGLVGEISRWISETAQYPQEEMSTAAALAFVGALKAHRVKSETDLRTNLLFANIAPSGSGKNWPLIAIKKLSVAASVQGMLLPKPASDSALAHSLRYAQGRGLLLWDEFGDGLKAITSNRAGTFQREILGAMKELFSSADTIFQHKGYAEGSQRDPIVINQPCLCVVGASTPEIFYRSLSSSLAEDGFISRFLFIEPEKPYVEERFIEQGKPPGELLARIQAVSLWPTDSELGMNEGNLAPFAIRPRVVPLSAPARVLLRNHSEYIAQRVKSSPDEFRRAIWSRAKEHTLKIALTVTEGLEIGVLELFWAFEFVTENIQKFLSKFSERIVESPRERDLQRVLRFIREKGEIARSDLMRKTQWLTKRELDDFLDRLIEAKEIYRVIDKLPGSRKSSVIYGWLANNE